MHFQPRVISQTQSLHIQEPSYSILVLIMPVINQCPINRLLLNSKLFNIIQNILFSPHCCELKLEISSTRKRNVLDYFSLNSYNVVTHFIILTAISLTLYICVLILGSCNLQSMNQSIIYCTLRGESKTDVTTITCNSRQCDNISSPLYKLFIIHTQYLIISYKCVYVYLLQLHVRPYTGIYIYVISKQYDSTHILTPRGGGVNPGTRPWHKDTLVNKIQGKGSLLQWYIRLE